MSETARETGQLERYDGTPCASGRLEGEGWTLDWAVPEGTRAYDVVPIRYELSREKRAGRVAVEAVAFEDPGRAQGRKLYDMAIPGDLSVNIEYLGSVCADFVKERYVPLRSSDSPPSGFPPYDRDDLVRSGTIRAADACWFKFRVTNTGDTIFDPDGLGTTFASPYIHKLDEEGAREWTARPINQLERHLDYIYPGESWELWVNFYCPEFHLQSGGLRPGEYEIEFQLLSKRYREWHWGVNIWHGSPFVALRFPLTVREAPRQTPVETEQVALDAEDRTPGYIAAFEEFMTTFEILPPADEEEREGTLYLQVAPWTEEVVLKVITPDGGGIETARVPVEVSDETLAIRYNPDNPMVVETEGGGEEPVFIAMAMPGMRSGIQLGPYAEEHLRDRIHLLKDLGVNVISNTSGDWWLRDVTGFDEVALLSAQYKYWYDVLMREAGLKCLGWSVYPPSGLRWYENAGPLFGHELDPARSPAVYGDRAGVDIGDPLVPRVIARWAEFNHSRWGDYWYRDKLGRVPVDIEDTWGWLRDDINLRYMLGPKGLARFRAWLMDRYGSLEAINVAWGTDYERLEDIDPQRDQGIEGDGLTQGPVYNKPAHPFHDWSPAVNDWDRFRTWLRMDIYREANRLMQDEIPGAELAPRTEGANLVIPGDPKGEPHLRHVYYSQRRNAMVFDVVEQADVVHFYSDYTTLPYSVPEWRRGMREMTEAGVVPAFLPTFNRMRDILLNPHYGREYVTHYGLEEPSQGMLVFCLTAAYPWWKATYEEGGAPGIIWSDYLCDAFATVTQMKELQLLREHWDRMDQAEPDANPRGAQ